jgi:hypothetical protein
VLKKHLFDASEEEMRAMVQEFLDQREMQEALAARELYRVKSAFTMKPSPH